MQHVIKPAAINALGTAVYVIGVATLLFYAPKVFGQGEDTVFIPIAMLLLLVCSAAVCGALLFGRPILWYLDGKKKEALSLLMATLGIFFVVTAVAFVMVAVA